MRCKAHDRPKQRHVSGFKQFGQGAYGNRRRNGRFSFFLGRMMLVQIGGGPRPHCGKKNNGPICDCGPGRGPKTRKGPHSGTCATKLLDDGNVQRKPPPPKAPSAQTSKNDDGPSECNCGPGGGPKSGKGPHFGFCATKVARDEWQRYPPPKAPPAQARTYLEKESTPSGRHKRVRIVAAGGMDNDDRTKRNAPVLGVMAEVTRENTPEGASRKRRVEVSEHARCAREHERLNKEKDGAEPPVAKKLTWAASRFNKREGESEQERNTRVLADLGSASERHARIRARDARLRSDRMHREHTKTPHGVFPPPCPKSDEGATPLRRLELYYEKLWALGEEAAICENCRQKDVGIGVGDGAIGSADEKICAFCRDQPGAIHWTNGLDLDLRPEAEPRESGEIANDTDTSCSARDQWAALRKKHGELLPIEEAMISPVCACFSVLKLPSGGQLGYRGNVINFTYDVAKVRLRLDPGASHDTTIPNIFFEISGDTPTAACCERLWGCGLPCSLQEKAHSRWRHDDR